MAIVLWAVCVAFLAHLWMKSGFYRSHGVIGGDIGGTDSGTEAEITHSTVESIGLALRERLDIEVDLA